MTVDLDDRAGRGGRDQAAARPSQKEPVAAATAAQAKAPTM